MNYSPLCRGALRAGCVIIASTFFGALGASATDPIESALSASFASIVWSFEPTQRKAALYDFDDDERFDLRLAPFGLEGIEVNDLSDTQWSALRAALDGVLSETGSRKVHTIRSLEREVAAVEGGFFGFLMDRFRDAKRYFLALFGNPGAGEAWGLRFDGHHLSLNWTAVPGEALSVTPLFMGAQPRVVPADLERAGLRVLADEEELGLAFARSLDAEQRSVAEIRFSRGSLTSRPLFVGAGSRLSVEAPSGIARSALRAEQQLALDALIDLYFATFNRAVAERMRARVDAEADSIHYVFATADAGAVGSPAAGQPSYYRIQSASSLIEFDNTVAEADHIHVVVRERAGDFGRDLLAAHHATAHGD